MDLSAFNFLGRTFDDFLFRPHIGIVRSRKEVDVSMRLFPNYVLPVPVMAANMDMLSSRLMAIRMAAAGGVAVLGVGPDTPSDLRALRELGMRVGLAVRAHQVDTVERYGLNVPDFYIIDMAHGHSIVMKETLARIRSKASPMAVIGAGNVATAEGASALMSWGADFVKVGIGPGSCCLTRLKTAAGVPQLQAIWECSAVAPVVADGGIRHEKDIFLAIACGARAVMLGGMLAGTSEATGGGTLRGMASREADPTGTAPPEGTIRTFEQRGSVIDVVADIKGYLQSSVSYAGENRLVDVQHKVGRDPAKYLIPISEAAREESFTR